MDPSAVSRLTEINENLKKELWNLRETAANLETEKQQINNDNKCMKEQNRCLEAKIVCFKAMAEELEKEEAELQVKAQQLEATVQQLKCQNQILIETNRLLKAEIQSVSNRLIVFQDYEATQDQDISRLKQVMDNLVNYFKEMEAKTDLTEQKYQEELNQISELMHTLNELEQIQEVQENEITCLRQQLDEVSLLKTEADEDTMAPSLLHEMVQAKLVQDSLAMQKSLLFLLSKVMWLMLTAILCLGILSGSIKLYIFMFNQDLEPESKLYLLLDYLMPAFFLDAVSPPLAKEPNGLLPF